MKTEDRLCIVAIIVIGAGIILAATGCEPLVDNSEDAAPPVTVVVSNATPGVYVNSGDGSVIVIGNQNETGVAPDMSVDNSTRGEP